MRTVMSAALAAVLLASGLSACTSTGGRCVDFIALDSPQQRFDAASTVVLAEVRSTGRSVEPFAVYPVYRAMTLRELKGTAPHAFDFIAPSDQCERQGARAGYLEGDPLAEFHRGVLYLVEDERVWRLITPGGLDPLPAGADLPFATAELALTPR